MTTLWHHRDFRLMWAGETIAQFGSAVSRVALPLVAITLLAATPFEVGLLTAAGYAAFLLVGLPSGAWVDRWAKRRLMIRMDLVRVVLFGSVPLAWWLGVLTLTQLVVVALLAGIATVFFEVAYQSYLPTLVSRDQLVEGNGKLETTRSLADVTGPGLGGGLVSLVGAATAMAADAIGFAVSALALSRIRTPETPPTRTERRSLRVEVSEGLRFVLGHRLLRPIVLCTGTGNLFSSMLGATVVLFLTRDLGQSPLIVGLLLGAGGVGGVAAALTASWWINRIGQARAIWLIPALTWPFALLQPLAFPGVGLALFAVGSIGFGYSVIIYNIAQVSFRQAITPDRLLGRMNASIRFLVWGTMPIGALIGGLIAQWFGVRTAVAVGAVGETLAVLWVVFSPLRHLRDLPTSPVVEEPTVATPA